MKKLSIRSASADIQSRLSSILLDRKKNEAKQIAEVFYKG